METQSTKLVGVNRRYIESLGDVAEVEPGILSVITEDGKQQKWVKAFGEAFYRQVG